MLCATLVAEVAGVVGGGLPVCDALVGRGGASAASVPASGSAAAGLRRGTRQDYGVLYASFGSPSGIAGGRMPSVSRKLRTDRKSVERVSRILSTGMNLMSDKRKKSLKMLKSWNIYLIFATNNK